MAEHLVPFGEEINLAIREFWREYVFPGGDVVRIEEPMTLIISEGGHRIVDSAGMSHYVPTGWVHLRWMNRPERGGVGFACQENRGEVPL